MRTAESRAPHAHAHPWKPSGQDVRSRVPLYTGHFLGWGRFLGKSFVWMVVITHEIWLQRGR